MKELFCIIFSFFTLSLFSECNSASSNENIGNFIIQDTNKINNLSIEVDPWWPNLCDMDEFKVFPACNEVDFCSEYYVVKLSNDTYKELVEIVILFKDEKVGNIYCVQFVIAPDKTENKIISRFKHDLEYIHPLFLKPYFLFYNKPRKVSSIRKKGGIQKVDLFFNKTIWNLAEDTTIPRLDPEVWRVDAYKEGVKRTIRRNSGRDSVFYGGIQQVLDICNISAYRRQY